MADTPDPTPQPRSALGRFRDKVLGNRMAKRQWREHKRRVKALPPDYRIVMDKIQKFLWTCGGAVDDQGWQVLFDISEVFEEAAAQGRPVLEVTGDDVAQFSMDMLAATGPTTWMGQRAEKMNAELRKLLGNEGDDDR
jgi:DNA-binding ferritin-like protein (Dps family)